ncbi:hypothetical protein [Pseudorhodoferax soli]|uniref:Uncharacterized protein n=1 Tax=Pseudorhodoferax soli TaxID=545864 RepID=A0A368Y398_9BURK|nr:hypothetical protein [Pseudorhodoferax soli]RCW73836.1 hypothetical protein DES41_102150 [Pseudorhodoferax soli]
MVTNPTEHAAVVAAHASRAALTIDRGPVSLRKLYLPDVFASQAAYDLASNLARKANRDFGAALHLCALARMDLHERVERVVIRGGLLHIGAPGLCA